ncbi:preprotein translocase subunit SecE [Aerococcus kribbianus]|uniref:Protein translocase subunit SecE n=1 Tax=Aerococcus kribbianus TaxID=2999064 RepID=A0A9X3JF80_9LACT|nr:MULTISPECIES: preprotein translocase subunit SecE [unclassified Aerococcus]MCZ0717950.1 preprotein translocase subunit SecE [Aerococcus sp. YH-aer221]MCZ0726237.1 preprotein translocase subunit SecE [Aerococcus sp. YH-aer222]
MAFIKNVFNEMRLVTWPTGKELLRYTGIVLGTIILVALFLGIVDYGASLAFEWFIGL